MVKTTVLFADLNDFESVNAIYSDCEFCCLDTSVSKCCVVSHCSADFTDKGKEPARAAFQAAQLPKVGTDRAINYMS